MARAPGGGGRARARTWLAITLVGWVVFVIACALSVLGPRLAMPLWSTVIALVAAMVLSGFGLWRLSRHVERLYDGLDRVRGDLLMVTAHRAPPGLPRADAGRDRTAEGLARLVASLGDSLAETAARPDRRLAAVVAALPSAVVVVTNSGQVSLVNGAAKTLLGAARVTAGTSIFAALHRSEVTEAMARARDHQGPLAIDLATVDARRLAAHVIDLGGHDGAVFAFTASAIDGVGELDHALDLHDRAPRRPPPTDAMSLRDLPILALDTETTGLDVSGDSVVAIGAVCMVGPDIFRADVIDLLVKPPRPIPARSTRIHGIIDGMVANASPFVDHWPAVSALMVDRVVLGHNIGFDVAILSQEAQRAGLAWSAPPSLDLLHLIAALEPRTFPPSLDGLANQLGVAVTGRHTALGDALVAAEIWRRLIPRLADHDVTTFGAAKAFAARAKVIIRQQKASGW